MDPEQQARQAVLDALLGRQPLPGGVQPLVFPDANLVDAPVVLLVVEPADPPLRLPERVRAVTRQHLGDLFDQPGVPVLEFMRPEIFPGKVGARLRISTTDDRQRLVPLGEVVATFTRGRHSSLEVGEPTNVVAY